MDATRITGTDAIDYARTHGLTLCSYTDPTAEGREGLSVAEAEAIAREDGNLVYLDLGIAITASNARPTSLDVTGGLDVDVTVSLSGTPHTGTALMVPDVINGGWEAYGNTLDMWLSDSLMIAVAAIEDVVEESECTAVVTAIMSAAAVACYVDA